MLTISVSALSFICVLFCVPWPVIVILVLVLQHINIRFVREIVAEEENSQSPDLMLQCIGTADDDAPVISFFPR